MNTRACSACGTENDNVRVYCSQCGGIMPATAAKPRAAAGKDLARLRSSKVGGSFFSRLSSLFFYIMAVALGAVIVLALMEPKIIPEENPPVRNARALVDQVLSASRLTSVILSQQLMDELLRTSGKAEWTPPFDSFPVLQWRGARVVLSPGRVDYFLDLTYLGYPLHFSESFRVAGVPRQWRLEPISGSIGLLPVSGNLLIPLTSFMHSTTGAVDQELSALASAEKLQVRKGVVEFGGR